MRSIVRAAAVAFALVVVVAACGSDSPTGPNADPNVLLDRDVTVGANGGAAAVSFVGTAGTQIRITLKGSPRTVGGAFLTPEPYGFLTTPSGGESYTPALENASAGENAADLTLTETGTYQFTVFDGSGPGAKIHVKVAKLG